MVPLILLLHRIPQQIAPAIFGGNFGGLAPEGQGSIHGGAIGVLGNRVALDVAVYVILIRPILLISVRVGILKLILVHKLEFIASRLIGAQGGLLPQSVPIGSLSKRHIEGVFPQPGLSVGVGTARLERL